MLVGLLLPAVLLCGCESKADLEALKERVLGRCTPLAEAWFRENLPDAKELSVEPFFFSRSEVCFDIVTGQYTGNGKTYWYYLNVDSGEFCSEEYFESLYASMKSYLTGLLTMKYEWIYFPPEETVLHGRVADASDRGYREYPSGDYEISQKFFHAYRKYAPEELPGILEEIFSADYEWQVTLKKPKQVLADLSAIDFLKEHTNWTLVLMESAGEQLDIRVNYEDGKWRVAEAFYDDRGIRQYRIYDPEQER